MPSAPGATTRDETTTIGRQELERWLCGADATVPTLAATAAALGVALDASDDAALRRELRRLAAARFTVAVLRDTFTRDEEVRGWLRAPRAALGGLSALDALWAGEVTAVEALAMAEWRGPAVPPVDAQRRDATASRSPSTTNSAPVARSSSFAVRALLRSRPAAPLAPSATARFTRVPVVLKRRPSAST